MKLLVTPFGATLPSMAMQPSIRFFEDSEGNRVAYASHGQGPPVVVAAWWVSHLEEDWENPTYRYFFEGLARNHRVIRFDRLGAGLSDRKRDVIDLPSEVATLSGLMDHLELETAGILGIACAGPPAIVYAAQNPERVTHLALFGSYVDGQDVGKAEVKLALQTLVRTHWGLGSKALADLFSPDLSTEERTAMSRAQRSAASAEMSARLLALTFDVEVREDAAALKAKTLVVHRKRDSAIPFSAGRELAASLPNAVLVALDGNQHVPWLGDVDAAIEVLLDFFHSEDAGETGAGKSPREAQPVNQMRLEGDLWHVSFLGQNVHVPAALGLEDLATLLSRPSEEILALELWSGEGGGSELESGSDPILDEKALTKYRERLAEIEQALTQAEERGHSAQAEAHRMERDALARQLRQSVGLGGKRRGLGDEAERARKAVSARVRASIKKITAVHPQLGEHLHAQVKTGMYCSYEAAGLSWHIHR